MIGGNFDIQWTHLYEVLERYGDYFIQQARENLGRNKSYASGLLGDSMRRTVEIAGDHFAVYIELQDYWEYVEKGRRPGKFPPPNRIKEWISVKPVKAYPNARGKMPTVEQLSFLIGRKIATKGIPPKPFFKPAKEATEQYFKEAIALAIDEDVSTFIEERVIKQLLYNDLFKIL